MGFHERNLGRVPQQEGLQSQTKNNLKRKAENALRAFEEGNTNLGETILSSAFIFMANVPEKEKDSQFESLHTQFTQADKHRKSGMPQFLMEVLLKIANS